jgi:hypothetical protein
VTGGRVGVVAVACAVVFSACGRTSSHPKQVVVGRDSATGKRATAEATADVGVEPVSLRVTATPSQRITGSWTIACRQGAAMARDADHFAGRTPLTVAMRPVEFSLAKKCTAIVDATLAKSGRLRVEILAE